MSLLRPSLDARHVTRSAAYSESLATHALKKRITSDEIAKGIVFDAAKVLPVSFLLAWAQSLFPWPKPANADAPPAQQLPQPGVPSPQNPTGGYYPGGPVIQDPSTQPSTSPQSYYDPRTNQQAYYQDPRLQDPRYVAALQQQSQQLASAGVQPPTQGSQPEQGFGRTQADFSRIAPSN